MAKTLNQKHHFDSLEKKSEACDCGNLLEKGRKYCSQQCYQTRNVKFDPEKAYTSLPISEKHYYGAMKWGYDLDFESDRNRQSQDQTWHYKFEPLTRPPLEFDQENYLAAESIADEADSYGLELKLFLSGGLDSIIMVDTFRQAGIPFTVVTWRFTTGENDHDTKHAIAYCEKYDLKQEFIDVDIRDFFFNKSLEYGLPIQSISPGRVLMPYVIDQVEGFPVFGGGEPFVFWDFNPRHQKDCVQTSEGEAMQYIEKWLTYRDRPGCGRFFRWTTEQTVSGIISDPFWKVILFMEQIGDTLPAFSNVYGHPRNKKRRETESSQAKHNAYKKYYPHIDTFRPPIEHEWQGPEAGLLRKTTAYTGYEFVEKEFRIANHLQMKVLPIHIFQRWMDEPVIERLKRLGAPSFINGKRWFMMQREIENAQMDNTKAERIKRHVGL